MSRVDEEDDWLVWMGWGGLTWRRDDGWLVS